MPASTASRLALFSCVLLSVVSGRPAVPAFSMPIDDTTEVTAAVSTQQAIEHSDPSSMRFGKFLIDSSSIFYRTAKSAAFVNLRPIVPGHVLVMPHRVVPTMEQLTDEEYVDLWRSARDVQAVLKQHYRATAFNVAVQDGRAAGQSVPHVHVHILPRKQGDFERNDDIYEELERWAPRDDLKRDPSTLEVLDDAERRDRTPQTMADEAEIYRKLFQQQNDATTTTQGNDSKL